MAKWDNLATLGVSEEMEELHAQGVRDGYSAGEKLGRHHPEFSSKPYRDWSPTERGYMFGLSLWMWEVGLY